VTGRNGTQEKNCHKSSEFTFPSFYNRLSMIPRPLRVLQIIPTLDRSGAEKQMVMLAIALPRERYHVEVAALTRLGPLASDLREAGIPIHALKKRFKLDPVTLARLTKLMREGRFDIAQTWIFAANVYGRIAARRAKIPIVLATEMAVDQWKSGAHLAIDRRLSSWTDRVVGNSDAVVAYYAQAGIPREKLVRIYSGIEPTEPATVDGGAVRVELGLAPDAPLILFAGRLYPQKRVDDLLFSLDLLQHVEPRARTLIVGDGPLRDRLIERANAFQLLDAKRVQFLGHRNDVPRLMAAADLVVLPSAYEGLPNVVLEAMRLAKPVVATAAPGTTEIVIDRRTGILVPIGDRPAMTKAIRAVIGDRDFARQLGEAGRLRIHSDFQLDTMVDQFATLYESLASEKRLRD
jgi:glycosyltransferase involved in cell wall biosynthesis